MTIFGDRYNPGNIALADIILVDYVKKFPPQPKGKGGHSRKKRGKINLTTYLHTYGNKKTRRSKRGRPRWDYEFFVTQMKNCRGWPASVADKEWERLAADQKNFADMGGPGGSKRLKIPSNLCGMDVSESSEEEFEEKKMQNSNKPVTNMSQDDQNALRGECRQGFGEVARPSSATEMSVALPPTAFTFEGEESAVTFKQFLQSHLKVAGSGGGGDDLGPSTPVKGGGLAADGKAATPSSADKAERPELVDIASCRTALWRQALKDIKLQEKKIAQVVASMGVALASHPYTVADQEDEYHTCYERLQGAMLMLNLKPGKKNDGSVTYEEFQPIKLQDCMASDRIELGLERKEASAPETVKAWSGDVDTIPALPDEQKKASEELRLGWLSTARLRRYLQLLVGLPIDSALDLESIKSYANAAESIRGITTEAELSDVGDKLENQKSLQNQFVAAMKTALKDDT